MSLLKLSSLLLSETNNLKRGNGVYIDHVNGFQINFTLPTLLIIVSFVFCLIILTLKKESKKNRHDFLG